MNKLLIICGPTATGKTRLAAHLAQQFNGELISADARQVYEGMDIGTGKDVSETTGVPLLLIDVVKPDEEFSVSHYAALASKAINHIKKRGKLPIVVGGTGLYIRSLVEPFETIHISPNVSLRKRLGRMNAQQLGCELESLDANAWNILNQSDRLNPRRLIRKIEIALFRQSNISSLTKNRLSRKMSRNQKSADQNVLQIGITAPLPDLYKRIDQRVDKRLTQGIIREIQGLLSKGYSWDLPAMNTLGYKEWKDYFASDMSPVTYDKAVQQWKYDEHAYARRQLTWFKKQKEIQWIDITKSSFVGDVTQKVASWYTAKASS